MDQMNRLERLEINPHIYSQLIFNKDDKNTQWEKDSLINKCYWEIEFPMQKNKTGPYHIPDIKII